MNQPPSVKGKGSRTLRNFVKENKKLRTGNKRNVTSFVANKDVKVLAERNPAVAPVGAWVENGHECHQHPEVRALLTEELLEETRREKEESLRRFQDAVRIRVSQQARLRKHQELLKSYENVECESRILQQTSRVTQHLTPQKSQISPLAHGELAICSQSSRGVSAQVLEAADSSQHHVSKVMKRVRHRLAACQTLQEADELSQLPGGKWKASPTKDTWRDEEDCVEGARDEEKSEQDVEAEEEIPLVGQPLNLHQHRRKTVTFQNDMVCEKILKRQDLNGPSTDFSTDYRASQVLWPHENQEEMKKQQRQSHFLMYRRLFMDIERERVKEHQRHRKHLNRTARIKSEKEQFRKAEEMKIELQRRQEEKRKEMEERECLILERLRLDEDEAAEEVKRKEKTKKSKETKRYIEAMHARMKEKLEKDKVDLPPLCCCGDTFWDIHPDTCANNCVFYNNPKVYAQAMQSVLLNCDLKDGGLGQYISTWKTQSMF
ncbi:Coiled-coil domain-containing protein 15 [Triplophysa tibetana]|uniref:Coiled-coil domain-containing protein 15 n=1 Tax=Triplophysa tibetana TaxID=1572043 RepID=A0A5A9P5T8_9TELE|nr:Coiled-coil domain-containing protein 15 [Triplophysa tibetana]